MELVVDANVLFAALIGKGKTQELFLENKIKLVAPLKLIEEFENNRLVIAEKGKVSVQELMESFKLLKEKIELYSTDTISSEIRFKAVTLAPHSKDAPYFALALYLGCAIWSREEAFKKQKEVKVYSTEELVNMFLKA